jgi:3-oxoacyl-[acyl-carrier protein] reductase
MTTDVTYVSGSTGFLGQKVALHLLEKGSRVLLGGRKEIELQELFVKLKKNFGSQMVGAINCDLSKSEEWYGLTKQLDLYEVTKFVNCAGLQGPIAPVIELKNEDFTEAFNVNLFSAVFLTKYFLLKPEKNDFSSIIHFSGGGATSARPFFAPYSLSKTALVRFVENVALENQGRGVSINIIAPGVMPSQMQSEIMNSTLLSKTHEVDSAKQSFLDHSNELQTLLELIEFLLSKKSAGLSGKLISAKWDNWGNWAKHLDKIQESDLYTLRRVTARDRGESWGDL